MPITTFIPTYSRPVNYISNRLARLNSLVKPGLSEDDFRRLFAKCRCGLIMTRHVFGAHSCAATTPEVIDLTSDAGVNSAEIASIPIIIDLTGDSDDD